MINTKISRKTAGYTLVETILVLAVVGLIVGAIWIGYSTAVRMQNDALEDQQIADELQMIRNYLQQYNENNSLVYDPSGNRLVITDQFVNKNLLSGSLQAVLMSAPDDGNNYEIKTEYAKNGIGTVASVGNPYGSGPLLALGFYNFSPQGCTNILSTWAGSPDRIQSSGLVVVAKLFTWVSAQDTEAGNLITGNMKSLQSSDIQNACYNNPGTLIMLLFRVNQ